MSAAETMRAMVNAVDGPKHTIKQQTKEMLLEAYRAAHMNNASFERIRTGNPAPGEVLFPTAEKGVTAFIRERTKIYRDSWIIGPLAEALDDLGLQQEREALDRTLTGGG